MHGTVLDVAWEVVARDGSELRLRTSLAPPWPYAGAVEQRLLLSPERLLARLSVLAEQDMPAWTGLHPWFPRRLARGSEVQVVLRPGRQPAVRALNQRRTHG